MDPHAPTPTVTLIIVTYNSAAIVGKTLESIKAQTYPQASIHTVIVDNASRDNTVRLVRENYPWVTVIPESTNHGFARGNNIAMRRHPADFFALVNADVVLHPDWLAEAIRAMGSDASIGVTGSKIFYGNRVLLQHAGGMFRENALTYHLGVNEFDIGQHDTPRDIDYAIGAAFVTRGDLARSLGYLPEAYFMYFEEAEYCVRVRRAGRRVVYTPTAVAYHDEKHSQSGSFSLRFLLLYHRARYLFALRVMTTADERQRFCRAEREWLRQSARDWRYRLLLLRSLLMNWSYLKAEPWLLRVWWPFGNP
jgi:hypothetical protein